MGKIPYLIRKLSTLLKQFQSEFIAKDNIISQQDKTHLLQNIENV